MRITWWWCCCFLLSLSIGHPAAQRGEGPSAAEQFVGVWSGTWDGAGSGGFELTIEKGADGAVKGRVSVTGEPTYKAAFKTVSFDGKKMSAKYDFPPDEGAEVVLAASFEGNKASGTWSIHAKGNDNEAAAGTWTVTKKQD